MSEGGRTKHNDLRQQSKCLTEELRGMDRPTDGHFKALRDHEAGLAQEGRK